MKTKDIRDFDVCIIGGGAAGLFCAANIKRNNSSISVAVLEKQKDIGKKLLATGNGRCNLTNLYADASMYHGTFKDAAVTLLDTCSPELIIGLFKDFGLLTTNDAEGRVYPYSKHSASVLECLRLNCINRNVDIICECMVTDVSKENECFILKDADNNQYKCKKLIVASGSRATPETGADDTILHIISKKFKHTITPLYPSLCPVFVKSKGLHNLKGVRANGSATIIVDGKELKREQGEIQFTEKALSGICLFNLARIANKSDSACIRLSLLPDFSEYEIAKLLTEKAEKLYSSSPVECLLIGIFQRKLARALLKDTEIDISRTMESVSKNDLRRLAKLINNWDFPVVPSKDFTRAQVVAGGIDGKEINPETMESLIINNLYFIGEATDCDGDCGGLNLQFAFASGYRAAQGMTI